MSDIEQGDNREASRWKRDKIRRRSQSPPYDNGTGSFRERSPINGRDPYRDEHYDKRPRVSGHYSSSRSIGDPYSQEAVISYERFIRWYSQENSISSTTEDLYKSLHATYNSYKQDLYARNAKNFVLDHCNEAWFEDAYWFDESQGRLREISEKEKLYRLSMHNIFLEKFENGYYDTFKLPNDQDIPVEVKNMSNEINPDMESIINAVPYFKYILDSKELAKDRTLLIRHVLPNISMTNMHQVFDGIDIIDYFSVSRMKFTKDYERSVWVHLKPDVAIEGAKEILNGVQLASNYTIETENPKFPRNCVPASLPSIVSSNDTSKKILNILFKIMNRFVVMYNLPQDISEKLQDKVFSVPVETEDEVEKERLHDVQLCDLLVEYLRHVATFDFWTCRNYSSLIALLQDNPAGYSRKSYDGNNEVSQEETVWLSNLENDYACLLDPESVDLKSKGALPVDNYVDSEIDSVILREDEQKYRCHVGTCTKLFLGPKFVIKHITKKHPDWLDHVKKVAICLRNYVLDPGRVMDPKVVSPSHAAQYLANKNHSMSYAGNSYDRKRNGLEFEDLQHNSFQKPYYRQDTYSERRDHHKDYRDLDAPTQKIPELDY
ncbi:zf-C2H2 type zinc finger protein [Schizosaccharomyces octosporus yFS286]|uniref:Zf-C2H2 type zinc finger protein n=1 Tax=Schizosaccharomyces octosporus (strain yFS286) TaxID=483514 RepID=S9R7K5_SCHOY|nr:zf-C2H2 type zinc finger protein [Schizosaccharomyces octosporus yFS286]EPX74215.1 zf-C2H2 type zinc finger protein [Schizosaccharomyces octosporus yFS286]